MNGQALQHAIRWLGEVSKDGGALGNEMPSLVTIYNASPDESSCVMVTMEWESGGFMDHIVEPTGEVSLWDGDMTKSAG